MKKFFEWQDRVDGCMVGSKDSASIYIINEELVNYNNDTTGIINFHEGYKEIAREEFSNRAEESKWPQINNMDQFLEYFSIRVTGPVYRMQKK